MWNMFKVNNKDSRTTTFSRIRIEYGEILRISPYSVLLGLWESHLYEENMKKGKNNYDPKSMKLEFEYFTPIPVGIYLLKVNNRNIRTRREICSKFTRIRK